MSIPHHKSERMFRRYEEAIFRLTSEWRNKPSAVTFNPRPLSTTTYICRFRDAVSSLLEYNWPTCIDVELLRTIRPLFEVVEHDGMVVIRPRGTKELPKAGELHDIATPTTFAFELDNPEPAVLYAAAILIDRKIIQLPVKLRNIPPNLLDEVASRFDVGISNDPSGYQIML